MKSLTIAGRIGKNAETRTVNDTSVTSFSVAVDDRSSKDATALWFEASLWGKRGESLAQYLTKGSNVTVTGDLTRREYEGKTYLGIRANDVTLQGGKPSDSQSDTGGNNGGSSGGFGGQSDNMSDEIPF